MINVKTTLLKLWRYYVKYRVLKRYFFVKYRILMLCFYVKYRVLRFFFVSLHPKYHRYG